MCPWLLMCRNFTYSVCSECVRSGTRPLSGRLPNGSWDTVQKIYCSSKVPLFKGRSQQSWRPLLEMCVGWKVWIFRKISPMAARHAQKVHCSTSKVSLIIDWFHQTSDILEACAWGARYECSGKTLQWKPRYRQGNYIAVQVKCPYYRPIATKITPFVGSKLGVPLADFRKISRMQAELQTKRHIVLQVMSSLL